MADSNITYTKPASVALPKNRKWKTTGLIVLAIIVPPLAIYLDGGSSTNIIVNAVLWFFLFGILAVIHAIWYVLRSTERRMYSRPARYRLWVRNSPGVKEHVAASVPAGLYDPIDNMSKANLTLPASTKRERNPFEDPVMIKGHSPADTAITAPQPKLLAEDHALTKGTLESKEAATVEIEYPNRTSAQQAPDRIPTPRPLEDSATHQ